MHGCKSTLGTKAIEAVWQILEDTVRVTQITQAATGKAKKNPKYTAADNVIFTRWIHMSQERDMSLYYPSWDTYLIFAAVY